MPSTGSLIRLDDDLVDDRLMHLSNCWGGHPKRTRQWASPTVGCRRIPIRC